MFYNFSYKTCKFFLYILINFLEVKQSSIFIIIVLGLPKYLAFENVWWTLS